MLTLITNLNAVVNKYLTRLQDLKPGGKVLDDALHTAADEALTSSRERIHTRGQAGDGSAIGAYSTAPMYVSMSRVPAPADAVGKRGTATFANGKPHRSHYYAGGYNDYKTAIGLNTSGSVNLTLTGEMRDSYQVIKTADGYGLGWDDAEIAQRAEVLESKYGKKIWTLTEKELQSLVTTVAEKLDIN